MKKTIFAWFMAASVAAYAQTNAPGAPPETAAPVPPAAPVTDDVDEKPIIITATRIETRIDRAADSVTVITRKDIDARGSETLVELLRTVAGIDVVKTGSIGGTTTLVLRGGPTPQTMVMIDGVDTASATTGVAEVTHLRTDDIERVEIVRGPQSALYGSAAVAGVVNVVTRKGTGKSALTVRAVGGNREQFETSATWSGAGGKGDFMLQVSGTGERGVRKNDRYASLGLASSWSHRFGDIQVQASARHTAARKGIQDGFPYNPTNQLVKGDDNRVNRLEFGVLTTEVSVRKWKWWTPTISARVFSDSLHDTDVPDTNDVTKATNRSAIETTRLGFGATSEFRPRSDLVVLVGIDLEGLGARNVRNDAVQFDKKTHRISPYILLSAGGSNVSLSVGARHDHSSRWNNAFTYRVAAAYFDGRTGLRPRFSFGTGFRAPTYNELYYPGFGRTNVRPEKSRAFEVGIDEERRLLDGGLRVRASGTYYRVRYTDFLTSSPTSFLATNVGSVTAQGVEAEIRVELPRLGPFVSGTYTYSNPRDDKTDARLPRRPKDQWGVSAGYSAPRVRASLTAIIVGQRHFSVYDPYAKDDGWRRLDLGVAIKPLKRLSIIGEVENLLNARYQEVPGYPAPLFTFRAGAAIEI